MTQAEARKLFDEIALELKLNPTWTLAFDMSKRRFGCCKYRPRVISLSAPICALNGPAEVGKTIRHEIAHALVGPGHGHGPVWQAMDVKCGGDGRRCFDHSVEIPKAALVATCPKCKKEYQMHRTPKRLSWCRCGAANSGAQKWDSAMALSFVPRPGTVIAPKTATDNPQVLAVLAMRSQGMGYVKIDAHFGVFGKKGWWSWKICKDFSGK